MHYRKIAVLMVAVGAWVFAAPVPAAETPKAGKEGWISLFDGKTLKGWHMRHKERKSFWGAENGELRNKGTGSDIVSDVKLMDHEMWVEFKVPKRGNSGVYLQGRYEVQVGDSYGQKKPGRGSCGAIYGKIVPKENASKPAGEWQTYHIKFTSARLGADGKVAKKARITVVHNKKTIIDNAEIDGLTGGAVDPKEGTPAGLMLQGDHSAVDYRNILYRPIKAGKKK